MLTTTFIHQFPFTIELYIFIGLLFSTFAFILKDFIFLTEQVYNEYPQLLFILVLLSPSSLKDIIPYTIFLVDSFLVFCFSPVLAYHSFVPRKTFTEKSAGNHMETFLYVICHLFLAAFKAVSSSLSLKF